MRPVALQGIIGRDVIAKIERYYDSIGTYRSEVMRKADPGESLDWVTPYIKMHVPEAGEFLGGNFYKHSQPYLPHTDHQVKWGDSINVVIPVALYDVTSLPHLLVFDQVWDRGTATWTLDLPIMPGVISSSTNEQIKGRPFDTPGVKGLTDRDVDEDFHRKYLSRDRSQYHGLSGVALPFVPGSLLVFPNKQIHGTAKFTGTKLGLSLRFKQRGNK